MLRKQLDLTIEIAFSSPFFLIRNQSGAVAQLEERHNGIVEVVGSIPIGSTRLKFKALRK